MSRHLVTIKSVQFHHFRCLKEVTVRLGPLTALVGPNATSKSTLLRGLAPRFVGLNSEDDSSVIVDEAPVDDPDWKLVSDEYQQSLGGLWLSGNLGGVPRSAA